MIEVRNLTKRFGATVAVDDLSFDVESGCVTGFLGPNGSGKSTTMRVMLGLDRAEAGTTRFGGRAYRELASPLREVGSLLDANYVHPSRSARDHLRAMAAANRIPTGRVDESLALVGLTEVARRAVGGFSLGMRQRLGLAGALLGDPATLVLDEPANGLDPEGIRWNRELLRALAAQGRTVFVSSHLLSEMAATADRLIVIGRGSLIASGSVTEFVDRFTTTSVRVRSPQADRLAAALARRGGGVARAADGSLSVTGLDAPAVGEAAAAEAVVLHELVTERASLEEAFLEGTREAQEYRSAGSAASEGP